MAASGRRRRGGDHGQGRGRRVVIVESPAKAKTVGGCLGAGYEVFATRGIVRDLPAKDGSVDPARDFALKYATKRSATATLGRIAAALRQADGLVLATDPDREGEAIAWQVLEWLRERGALKGKPVRRVVFHEVTAAAVRDALARPRDIDMDLVRAQQARRALDYLVGFHLSALLWRKIRGGRSAGRVQSVALRLVCAREAEIEAFEPEEYWTVDAGVMADAGGGFMARLSGLDGAELEKLSLQTDTAAEAAAERVRAGVFRVALRMRDAVRRDPVPPFTTATLQQEASRRLGFGPRKTMQIAQTLYDGVEFDGRTAGLVTYVRTDSVALSAGAAASARGVVSARFGADYLPRRARVFRSRARNAQEVHEAIRPADIARTPESVAGHIGADEAALYGLIWKRTVASQMAAARLERVRVALATEAGDVVLSAGGTRTAFDGFRRIWREDDAEGDTASGQDRPLPAMAEGERVFVAEVRPERRQTLAPPRYTEADLVRRLEALGIGRPSTYASIVGVLRERGYAVLYRRRFVPTERGRVVTAFLERYFRKWVAYRFTTDMEADLDRVAAGGMAWKAVLGAFWGAFEGALEKAGGLRRDDVRAAVERALSVYLFGPSGSSGKRPCPACADGKLMLKLGRFGPFVGCTNYPDCRYSRPLAADPADDREGRGPVPLGADPETGLALTLRRGRYGRFVQLGEQGDPRSARGTVPAAMAADEITPAVARALLALPRAVGAHPDTGKRILAGIGRYGAWLKHGNDYIALPDDEDVLTVGLNRAVALVDAKGGR
ncbi:MAG: type I DNA topoisomerase [Alphaproteobacteria bacterium]|nr:type I DNA topoisomerase [Alphaproteobacteria bacterium]